MLFVPNHGPLHSALIETKERLKYFNQSPKRKARYKETHLTRFRSPKDVRVAEEWIKLFVKHPCYFRCIIVDWSMWDSKYFGGPFEPESLKQRRAYKKWSEMLLHPELKEPLGGGSIVHARFLLDRLTIMYGYDVLDHLRERFTQNYQGESPYVESFEHVNSWRDAHQCLQLCDLLTGCVYQSLVPAKSGHKRCTRDYLANALKQFGVCEFRAGFWKQFTPNSLRDHFPKFSAWFWKPTEITKARRRKKAKRYR